MFKRCNNRCFSDIVDCTASSCNGKGECNEEVDGGFICICIAGWTGRVCGINLNECAGNPCGNGGTCTDGENMFTCACPAAWTGLTCGTGKRRKMHELGLFIIFFFEYDQP